MGGGAGEEPGQRGPSNNTAWWCISKLHPKQNAQSIWKAETWTRGYHQHPTSMRSAWRSSLPPALTGGGTKQCLGELSPTISIDCSLK